MKYCAFLRGVNVKGTAMKMAEVCSVFEKAGMLDVSSVLATGNIIFTSDKSKKELKPVLENAMSHHFGYEAFLFIKTKEEVNEIFKSNPFIKNENAHIYAFVTTEHTDLLLLEEFEKSKTAETEKGVIVNHTFFWQVEKGSTLDSDFGKILGKKAFKDKITSRNINTFEKIVLKL